MRQRNVENGNKAYGNIHIKFEFLIQIYCGMFYLLCALCGLIWMSTNSTVGKYLSRKFYTGMDIIITLRWK